MNKKGFTLIELIAVIVILGIVIILFMPNLLNIGGKVKDDEYDNKVVLIETAANNFIEDHKNSVKENIQMCITVEELIKLGYLTSENKNEASLLDPRDSNSTMNGIVQLTYDNVNNVWKATSKYGDSFDNCPLVNLNSDVVSNKYGSIDTLKPEPEFDINNDSKSTKYSEVDLIINDKNNVATMMCLSYNSEKCLIWEKYNTYRRFNLKDSNIDGEKTICLTLKTGNGYESSTICKKIDYKIIKPVITYNPSTSTNTKTGTTTIEVSDRYLDTSSTAYIWQDTNDETNVEFNNYKNRFNEKTISVTPTVSDDTVETKYLCTYATDTFYNHITVCSNKIIIDKKNPEITFSPDGNTNPDITHSTTITVSDDYIDVNSLKYVWSTSNNVNSINYNTSFSNKTIKNSAITESIVSPESLVENKYYLCVYAKDIAGNENKVCSTNTFNVIDESVIASISITSGTYNSTIGAYESSIKVKGTCTYVGGTGTLALSGSSTVDASAITSKTVTIKGPKENGKVTVTCKTKSGALSDTATTNFNIKIKSANTVCGTTPTTQANCDKCGSDTVTDDCPDWGSCCSSSTCKSGWTGWGKVDGETRKIRCC